MADAPDLAAMREGLLKAMGSGTLIVSAGGVSRTYRSIAELQAAIRAIDAQLDELNAAFNKFRQLKINAQRGW